MKQKRTVMATALAAALSLPAWAQDKHGGIVGTAEPGQAVLARTSRITATVEAVDVEKRELRLKGPRGHVLPLSVGDKVRNLDQIKVGDRISAEYLQALIVSLKKGGKEVPGPKAGAVAAGSAPGGTPAGVAARRTELTGNVTAVDRIKQIVTVRGAQRAIDLEVRDPDQLKLIKVGDQIQAVYTEAVALELDPVPRKGKK